MVGGGYSIALRRVPGGRDRRGVEGLFEEEKEEEEREDEEMTRPNRWDCMYCLSRTAFWDVLASCFYTLVLGIIAVRGGSHLDLPMIIILLDLVLLSVSFYWSLSNAWELGSRLVIFLFKGPKKHECRYFNNNEPIEEEQDD